MTGDVDAIIDRFRQAAFGMTSWSDALAGVGAAMASPMVHLVGLDAAGTTAFNLIHGATDDMMAEYFATGGLDPAINPRTRVALAYRPFACVVDEQTVDRRAVEGSPMYRLFRRSDADHAAMVPIVLPGVRGLFSTMRGRGTGMAGADERRLIATITPAVVDVMRQALALGTATDAAMLTTAEALGASVLLLDHGRRVVTMSADADALLLAGGYLTRRRGRIVATDPAADAALADAFDRATDPRRPRRGASRVVLRDAAGGAPIVVDMAPVPDRPSGPLSRVRAMLSVRQAPPPVSAALLGELYRLTPAEADVAQALAAGLDLKGIAVRRGCTIGTVRSQLKMLFEKTDTGRQGELIALLRQAG